MDGSDRHGDELIDPDLPGTPRLTAKDIALVFAGGIIGTASRYAVTELIGAYGEWPMATFAINVIGAFVLGLLIEALAGRGPDVGRGRGYRLLLGTGFCGAFTTYSALAVDTDLLLRHGLIGIALAYGIGTLIIGFLATLAGVWCGSRTVRPAS